MKDGTVEINMKQYIKEYIQVFGEDIFKGSNTPAKHNLFMIGYLDSLSEKVMDLFHRIIGKLLYISKRARMEIYLAVSFLCTIVA